MIPAFSNAHWKSHQRSKQNSRSWWEKALMAARTRRWMAFSLWNWPILFELFSVADKTTRRALVSPSPVVTATEHELHWPPVTWHQSLLWAKRNSRDCSGRKRKVILCSLFSCVLIEMFVSCSLLRNCHVVFVSKFLWNFVFSSTEIQDRNWENELASDFSKQSCHPAVIVIVVFVDTGRSYPKAQLEVWMAARPQRSQAPLFRHV